MQIGLVGRGCQERCKRVRNITETREGAIPSLVALESQSVGIKTVLSVCMKVSAGRGST